MLVELHSESTLSVITGSTGLTGAECYLRCVEHALFLHARLNLTYIIMIYIQEYSPPVGRGSRIRPPYSLRVVRGD